MTSTQSHTHKQMSREDIVSQNKAFCKSQPASYYEYEQAQLNFK